MSQQVVDITPQSPLYPIVLYTSQQQICEYKSFYLVVITHQTPNSLTRWNILQLFKHRSSNDNSSSGTTWHRNFEKHQRNIPTSLSSNSSQALPTFPPSLPLGYNTKENPRKQLKETHRTRGHTSFILA